MEKKSIFLSLSAIFLAAFFVVFFANQPKARAASDFCGDQFCSVNEDCNTCPGDCGQCLYQPTCPDKICSADENCETCPGDCGSCPIKIETTEVPPGSQCGNQQCESGEDCNNCSNDCGQCPITTETTKIPKEQCGDQQCSEKENCYNCPGDCGQCVPICGDQQCNGDENCSNCNQDCGQCSSTCGDQQCKDGETCRTCPNDCGQCPSECGDKICSADENCQKCPQDCGQCSDQCGNKQCDKNETCLNCSQDCGQCKKGNEITKNPPCTPQCCQALAQSNGSCKCYIKFWFINSCDLSWLWLILATIISGITWLIIGKANFLFRLLILIFAIILPLLVGYFICVWTGILVALVFILFRLVFLFLSMKNSENKTPKEQTKSSTKN